MIIVNLYQQLFLGTLVGFPEKTDDIRMAQYEAGTRTPKEDLTNALAGVLEVSPLALQVPDIDSYFGLMHTLFALEDLYGLTIERQSGEVIFRVDPNKEKDAATLHEMIDAWASVAEDYRSGKISKEEYDVWRYDYPQHDDTQVTAKNPSQEFSDALLKKYKDRLKD